MIDFEWKFLYYVSVKEIYVIEQELQYATLDWSAKPGFFIAEGGIRYWIFRSWRGLYAVRLDGSPDHQQFSSFRLGETTIATGAWLGPVKVKKGAEACRSFRGRVGLLGTSGLRFFLKVIDEAGCLVRLVILPSDLGTPHRHTSLYPDWKLILTVGPSEICVFDSPAVMPKVCRAVPSTQLPSPRLVWSTPSVEES